jgi:DNA-binding transcriptional ArsR family regulator
MVAPVDDSPAAEHRQATLRSAADLRAVAHPTRLRLLGALRVHGPQTGAQLGERVGEAPGTVSYHLRTLAAAGLVVPAEPRSTDRRARWWAAAHETTSWDPVVPDDDPESAAARTALQHAVGQLYAERWSAYVDAAGTLPPAWVAAGHSTDVLLRLTLDELDAMWSELHALASRWSAVSERHAAGDGSEPVTLVAQAYRIPR